MRTPFQPPLEPMLAKLSAQIPVGAGWLYEPKWDGFRTIVYADGDDVYLQSRDLKPLNRYFPEVEAGLLRELRGSMVLDGELVVFGAHGLDFDALQQRIHPAASRVQKLAAESPAAFVAFDLLAVGERDLRAERFSERRRLLEESLRTAGPPAHITPATADAALARDWFERFEGAGFDGVIAKRLDSPYQPGVRAMAKIKHVRTVDCVVGGFRWYKDSEGGAVGSLLLGLYDEQGVFHHVGHTSSFDAKAKRELVAILKPYCTDDDREGFGMGRTPGAPSRWSQGKDLSWVRLRPGLVCEVTFDHLQSDRFRHAATFQRWRSDKPPAACTFDQLEAAVPYELSRVFTGE